MSALKVEIWWSSKRMTSTGAIYPGLHWKGFSAVLKGDTNDDPVFVWNCEECAVFRWKRSDRSLEQCSCVCPTVSFFPHPVNLCQYKTRLEHRMQQLRLSARPSGPKSIGFPEVPQGHGRPTPSRRKILSQAPPRRATVLSTTKMRRIPPSNFDRYQKG